jgi:hypothetical protein
MKKLGMLKHVLILWALVACGGHKQADTTPPPDQGPTTTTDNSGGVMIPPEKMDEVTQDLKRKNMMVSRCLAEAMEAQEVPKGTHGHITFEIKIGTDGHTTSVKVIKTDVEAKSVIDCATKHVEDTAFPTMPKIYETSYTFAMEAN